MASLRLQIFLLMFGVAFANERPVWTWKCVENRCEKMAAVESEDPQGESVCKLLCDPHANLWPKPTGDLLVNHGLLPVNAHSVSVESSGQKTLSPQVQELVQGAGRLFQQELGRAAGVDDVKSESGARSLVVQLAIDDISAYRVASDTDESYHLKIAEMDDGRINSVVAARTFFGARHGLETLSQLIVYDDVSEQLVMPKEVDIKDAPVYPHRGILLDTARSYFSVASIKKTLDGMAASKLNTFHWHITDSHSFPFVSKKHPDFSRYGAYSPREVYTYDDVREIVEYARERGVRVVPELDQPAHVGEGWQWAPNTTVCFKAEPWTSYCVEPPCGQLDPTNERIYDILYDIYTEYLELFDSDIFHMGGDEVNFNCWNSSEVITTWMANNGYGREEADFLKLWKRFQDKSYARLIEANNGTELPVMLWTSHLTAKGQVEKNLDKDKYIIHIWTKGDDEVVPELVKQGFRVVFSNYEALYFDCGFGAWVGEGNNWCSPYIGWQKVYENDPRALLVEGGADSTAAASLALGAEATLFTEQADEAALDSRLWPRAAAMAERLWSRPTSSWRDAEWRILEHRERLLRRGLRPDQLEPEWCRQNPGYCYL